MATRKRSRDNSSYAYNKKYISKKDNGSPGVCSLVAGITNNKPSKPIVVHAVDDEPPASKKPQNSFTSKPHSILGNYKIPKKRKTVDLTSHASAELPHKDTLLTGSSTQPPPQKSAEVLVRIIGQARAHLQGGYPKRSAQPVNPKIIPSMASSLPPIKRNLRGSKQQEEVINVDSEDKKEALWDDTCLGLKHSVSRVEDESMESVIPETPDKDLQTLATQEIAEATENDDAMSTSSSLPCFDQYISSSNSPTEAVVTIDSQSDQESPLPSNPTSSTAHTVVSDDYESPTIISPPTHNHATCFLPPKPVSPPRRVKLPSCIASDSLSSPDDSTSGLKEHSNPFANNTVDKHNKKQLLTVINDSPCLSREEFSFDVPTKSKTEHTEKPVDSSALVRRPLSVDKVPKKQAGSFYGNNGGSVRNYSLYANHSIKPTNKSTLSSVRTSGRLLGKARRPPLKLKRSSRSISVSPEADDEETMQLKVSTVQIGRLIFQRVIHAEVLYGEINVHCDYEGHTENIKIEFDACVEFKMHLEDPPYVMLIIMKPTRALVHVSQLAKKYKLDSSFFNPKSSEESEKYVVLTLEERLSQQELEALRKNLSHARGPNKVLVQWNLSTENCKRLLDKLVPSKNARGQGRPLSNSDMKRFLDDTSMPPRRSLRSRKPPERLAGTSSDIIEYSPPEPTGPPRKLMTYNVPTGSKVNIEISTHDVHTLSPGAFLNDKVVDFYLRYIWYEKLVEDMRPKIHIFSSFFHTRLKDASRDSKAQLDTPQKMHNRVKTWTRRVDLFEKEYIILPVCEKSHWFVVFIYQAGKFDPEKEMEFRAAKTAEGKLRRKKLNLKRKSQKLQEVLPDVVIETSSTASDDKPAVPGLLLQEANNPSVELIPPDSCGELDIESSRELPSLNDMLNNSQQSEEIFAASSEPQSLEKIRESGALHEIKAADDVNSNTINLDSLSETDDTADLKSVDMDTAPVDADTADVNCPDNETEESTKSDPLPYDAPRPCVLVLDSLGVRRTGIVKTIRSYLTVEWKEKKTDQEELPFDILPAVYPKIPLQNNSSDCGVFLLQYVESLLQRMMEGESYPTSPDGWASYEKTGVKRKEIKELIHTLSNQSNTSSEAKS